MIKNPDQDININGSIFQVSAFGLADAHYDFTIYNATAPYKVKATVDNVVVKTIEGIPDDANGNGVVSITGLPPGEFKFEVWDSAGQYLPALTQQLIISPPFIIMNGEVNTLNVSTLVSFEIGEESGVYDHETQYGNLPPENEMVQVSTRLSAVTGAANPTSFLQPNKTYHYRIKAVQNGIPFYGEDQTFSTPPSAPIVHTLPATQ